MSAAARVVVDASALVAWACREPGAETVDRLLSIAVAPSSVMVETLYKCRERGHRMPPAELHDMLLVMGLRVEPVTDEDTVRGAELILQSRVTATKKDKRTLSLGDGLCLAVAERLNLTVTGGDDHWASLDLSVKYLPFR